MRKNRHGRLLIFNCHESWIYQFTSLNYELDIIVGLPGHHSKTWDTHARPIPPRARLITRAEAQRTQQQYACIIAHNPSDLLDIRHRTEPCILVLHLPVEARILLENSKMTPQSAQAILNQYTEITQTHIVAVSQLKGQSWGHTGDLIPFGFDCEDYQSPTYQIARGLRIANFIHQRQQFLKWDFHMQAFNDIPVTLIGHNPDMPQVAPSRDWTQLKTLLQTHRFYIHTADPSLEDGYNMASMEAMAAGLPVLGNCHPSSPVEHGVNGFLSDDPLELKAYAKRLIIQPELARDMGRAAQRTVQKYFALSQFAERMQQAIHTAQCKKASYTAAIKSEVSKPRQQPISIQELKLPSAQKATAPIQL
ncbi:glycosyltransferase family 4 protein [Planctomycetota bacterium]